MHASGFDAEAAPRERRALGYRWEDDAWRLEPTLGPGTFGAMGGLQTSANDYAKWVTFLLSAWPPRDGADAGPVRRATVRELAQGSNYPRMRDRPARTGTAPSRQPITYGMGMIVAIDDALGLTISHSGGYPGYRLARAAAAGPRHRHLRDGEPDLRRTFARGLGCRGRTRRKRDSSARSVKWRSASRSRLPTAPPARCTRQARVDAARDQLAMNFLLDRDAEALGARTREAQGGGRRVRHNLARSRRRARTRATSAGVASTAGSAAR